MIRYFYSYYRNNRFYLEFQSNDFIKRARVTHGDIVLLDNESFKMNSTVVVPLTEELPDLTIPFTVYAEGNNGSIETKVCNLYNLYQAEQFDNKYTYYGELGALYSKDKTIFRVWSPVSSKMVLRIYETGTPECFGGTDKYIEYEMVLMDKGVWEYTINSDLEGKYYTYVVTNFLYDNKEVVDPYAKSAGINGIRGMIVDFSKTNPEGWEDVKINEIAPQNLTVYESHIADLTSSSTWGGNPKNARLFKGFYEENTTYTENGITVKTGFDHIKELGVNAVQLLPIFDAHNDEREGYKKFNWGYDPQNYNSLDGIYSSNPYDGYERIKEFKSLVMAYNKAGINIIMDVVYNHMNSIEGSSFDALVPGYYFRYKNGVVSDASMCGNETASNMPMYSKFMIDSTYYWASEYKLGGFRFDLMGIHDLNTMEKLSKNLHDNISKSIVVYGEPWFASTPAYDIDKLAIQANLDKYNGYGCFNDKQRDALIKGGICKKEELGWVTNTCKSTYEDVENVVSGVIGRIIKNSNSYDSSQCVNYVTCHDNYTLYDRIEAAGIKDKDIIAKMAVLANSVIFTSLGISFILSGEEMLRSKGGNENSYNAPYEVNELNYSNKVKYISIFETYKKLIRFKQELEVISSCRKEEISLEVYKENDYSYIQYTLLNKEKNTEYLIIHTGDCSKAIRKDLSNYDIYLDTLGVVSNTHESVELQAFQTIIAKKSH